MVSPISIDAPALCACASATGAARSKMQPRRRAERWVVFMAWLLMAPSARSSRQRVGFVVAAGQEEERTLLCGAHVDALRRGRAERVPRARFQVRERGATAAARAQAGRRSVADARLAAERVELVVRRARAQAREVAVQIVGVGEGAEIAAGAEQPGLHVAIECAGRGAAAAGVQPDIVGRTRADHARVARVHHPTRRARRAATPAYRCRW